MLSYSRRDDALMNGTLNTRGKPMLISSVRCHNFPYREQGVSQHFGLLSGAPQQPYILIISNLLPNLAPNFSLVLIQPMSNLASDLASNQASSQHSALGWLG